MCTARIKKGLTPHWEGDEKTIYPDLGWVRFFNSRFTLILTVLQMSSDDFKPENTREVASKKKHYKVKFEWPNVRRFQFSHTVLTSC